MNVPVSSSEVESAKAALSLIHKFELFATLLVAVGVAMEFICSWCEKPYEVIVERAHEQEVARLTERAETLKQQLAWREVSKMQRDLIVSALKGKAGSANFLIVQDPEAAMYGHDLALALRAAGWEVTEGHAMWTPPSPLPGLFISKTVGADVLVSAFKAAGIDMPYGGEMPELTVLIGTKPRPVLEQPTQ